MKKKIKKSAQPDLLASVPSSRRKFVKSLVAGAFAVPLIAEYGCSSNIGSSLLPGLSGHQVGVLGGAGSGSGPGSCFKTEEERHKAAEDAIKDDFEACKKSEEETHESNKRSEEARHKSALEACGKDDSCQDSEEALHRKNEEDEEARHHAALKQCEDQHKLAQEQEEALHKQNEEKCEHSKH